MHRRIYIYRSGATDACALTVAKYEPRLPPACGRDTWQFWMQIGPLQAQNSLYGFDIRDAVHAITANGYYLFTGSAALLAGRPWTPPRPSSNESQSRA